MFNVHTQSISNRSPCVKAHVVRPLQLVMETHSIASEAHSQYAHGRENHALGRPAKSTAKLRADTRFSRDDASSPKVYPLQHQHSPTSVWQEVRNNTFAVVVS